MKTRNRSFFHNQVGWAALADSLDHAIGRRADGHGLHLPGQTRRGRERGSWSPLSDRNAKANFAEVDPCEVLGKVLALPITTWNYKAQGPEVRHIGPMAQDFHAAFGVGESDKTIPTIDADGVALAAIQGLNQKLEETRAENAVLKARLEKLEKLEQLLMRQNAQ